MRHRLPFACVAAAPRCLNSLRLLHVTALIALLCTLIPPASADEPPQKPILRIETGMHTAAITRIAVDAASRHLVTGSDDKTVRVWELSSGKLLQTLRVPVGEGNEGKINAVAITPDGSTIACGGWTGYEWDKSNSIYLFDRASGRLLRRISGMPNVILDLAYSPEGSFLAATLGGNNGIRIFRTSDYMLAAEDKEYGDSSYGAHFDRAGRLVTTCDDDLVRLYDARFRLLAKHKGPGDSNPFCARFSPDGSKVAVGYADSTRVDVLSGSDLSVLYAPDTSGVDNGDLGRVAWSGDGSTLWAGGRWQDASGRCALRRWSEAGRGAFTDLHAAKNTIMDLRPVQSGGIAFGAQDPAFGLFDAGGARTRFPAGAIADYRDNWQGFLVAGDGATVQFGYQLFGKIPARFTIGSRLLNAELPAASATNGLAPPLTQTAGGPSVTDWEGTYSPKLNGKPLALDQYERSRSLSLAPDGQSFLLGTNWSLRLFDTSGNERWSVPAPDVAWLVNIAGNGRVAVAAFADGTIRWYRMRDGRELLAFFPHADRKRWVLWTPSGYFDASPGGEDLIGWHLNQGKDTEAVFFPASRFRQARYRPDVIGYMLDLQDETEAVQLANEEAGGRRREVEIGKVLPPTVAIVSPADAAEVRDAQVRVKFAVRAPADAPATSFKVLVDGRPVGSPQPMAAAPAGAAQAEREITVTVPEQDCELSVLAMNQHAASVPATVRLRWRGGQRSRLATSGGVDPDAFVVQPKLYVLAVGVSSYADETLRLDYAAKDAGDFAKALLAQKGGLYRNVEVRVLTDGEATKENILDGLEWVERQTTSKDVAMVFFSGHGQNDRSGLYHFLPVRFTAERFRSTGLPFSDIKNVLENIAGKALFFMDTCHSGNVLGGRARDVLTTDITGVVNELASAENGVVVFAASTGKQVALENRAWNNGAFTKALVEGIGGKADYQRKGRITVLMLDLYLSERVKELTRGRQTPTTTKPKTIADFPIAVTLRGQTAARPAAEKAYFSRASF